MGFEASSQEKELAKTVLSKIDTQVSDIVVRDHAYQIFTGAGLPNCTLDRIWDIADPDKNGSLKEDHIAKALRLIGWAQAEKAPEPALLERVGPLATIKGIPIPGVTLFGGMSNYQSAISSYSRPATQPSPNVPQHGQSLKVIPPSSGMCNSSRNSSSSNLSAQGGSCPKTPSSASSIYPTHSQRIGPVAEPANPTQIPEVQIGERPVGVPESKPSQDVTPGKARDKSIRVEDTIAATTRSKWLEVERDMKRLTQGLSEEMSELKEEMSKMREEIATMRRHAVCINYSLLNTEKRLYGDKMGQPEDSTQEIQHGLGYPISTTAAELGPPHGERETSDPEMKGPLEQPIQNFAPMYSKIIFLFAICSVFLACFYFPRAPT